MNSTKHSPDCIATFGRRDPTCPRCVELARGAAPRQAWGQSAHRAKIHALAEAARQARGA